ncbi:hypothetical protein [Nostocoides sp. HKS02]|uniref:hypothetical protein n=1 Tax=Nostocoides sp. HKS02 TaxID=1813880 RepID=UPI0012B4A004|nr:hypothetical protein [Tetrasphaera sp. HKS02]QGN58554.1 hypothetical protein GKE56_12405 [Tetrasphaera sp. HKS02]
MTRTIRNRNARILGASAAGLAAVLALGTPSAGAAATPSQKVPLTQTNRSCDATVIPPVFAPAQGFAAVTRTATGKLAASVAVKGARPNTAYTIRLIQLLPDNSDCQGIDGTLTTDALGNGNANVQELLLPGATSAWVDLNGQNDFTNFYDTAPMSF